MELRVLRYFLAVAQEGSITGAANALHLTQPTLSRQMKELEEELGQRLFIRKSHSISLTAEGMILRKRAEEIVDMVNKTKAEFKSAQDIIAGEIYIGSGETQAMSIIAQAITKLQKKHPHIHYHIHSGNAEDVTERLDKGLLDFGLLIQPFDISKYDYINLPTTDVWGVIMNKASPLAQKKKISKQDLLNLPIICSRQILKPSASDNILFDWLGSEFEKLDIIATYNLLFNAALLAEQDCGYVLGLDKLVNTRNDNLCFRPLFPKLESKVVIAWKKHQIFSPAAKIFLETLKKISDNNTNT